MATPQPAILGKLEEHQWYVHLSRTQDKPADLGHIKKALRNLRADCAAQKVNLGLFFGPTLLSELVKDKDKDYPEDFQPYPGYKTADGKKVAKATQEELLVWVHSDRKGLCWETQHTFRNAVKGHMNVARETIAWIYKNSLDLTGYIDGTGNPEPKDQHDRAIIADGHKGAGGSFLIAQRWVHDLAYFKGLSPEGQDNTFGRTKADSTRLQHQVPTSHLSHVELRGKHGEHAKTGDANHPKRGEMVRRSTPYALHDGTVGLYFLGFCKTQAPLRERMEAMYGEVPDAITDYSTPASGSFYFGPSVEALDAALAG